MVALIQSLEEAEVRIGEDQAKSLSLSARFFEALWFRCLMPARTAMRELLHGGGGARRGLLPWAPRWLRGCRAGSSGHFEGLIARNGPGGRAQRCLYCGRRDCGR